MQGLHLGDNPEAPSLSHADVEEEMLIYHSYSWMEAVLPDEERNFQAIRLKRLSIDILLPGPTNLNQVRSIILPTGLLLRT